MLGRKSVQYVALELPAPLSTNALWRPIKRGSVASMVKSKEYCAWIAEAGYRLNSQRLDMVEGPYALSIVRDSGARLDLDNCIKSCSDLLQDHGIVQNDRLAQKITIERGSVEGGGMSVLVVSTYKVE